MAVESGLVTVGTSPTLLTTSTTPGAGIAPAHHSISVQNISAVTVYLGGSAVTTSDYGFALAAGDSCAFDMGNGEKLYGRVASSTASVAVLRIGV